jgi:flagellar FliL protein
MAMADDAAEETENPENAEAESEEGGKKRFSKKLILIVAAVVVLLVGAGAGAYTFGLLGGGSDEQKQVPEKVFFYEVPELTVNLSAGEQRAQFLRVQIALEVDSEETIQLIEPLMPRVIDTFQTYLRELRLSDLEGSAGMFRLKQELLRRINLAIYPAEVRAVLFREIIIQ